MKYGDRIAERYMMLSPIDLILFVIPGKSHLALSV